MKIRSGTPESNRISKSVGIPRRQALVGGHYGLLRVAEEGGVAPNPDYFAYRLWARLMGGRSLGTVVFRDKIGALLEEAESLRRAGAGRRGGAKDARSRDRPRAYAHCSSNGKRGDVVLLLVNSRGSAATLLPPAVLVKKAKKILAYVVTAPQPKSATAHLNGKPLAAVDQPMKPEKLNPQRLLYKGFKVPARSYAFFDFKDAKWPACRAL